MNHQPRLEHLVWFYSILDSLQHKIGIPKACRLFRSDGLA